MAACKRKTTPTKNVSRMIGHPVCVVLNDGNYYIGTIAGVENEQLVLSGKQPSAKRRASVAEKARLSGFSTPFSGAANAYNLFTGNAPSGAAATASGGGILGTLGFFNQMWPIFRMGFGMIRTIIPLFRAFKG